MVTINIEKRHLYLLSAVMVFLVGVGIVIGGSYTSPTTGIGHDFGELENVQFKITNGLTACDGDDESIKTINPATGAVTCETDDVTNCTTTTYPGGMPFSGYHYHWVDIPPQCFGSLCDYILREELVGTGSVRTIYQKSDDEIFLYQDGVSRVPDAINGDSTATWLLTAGDVHGGVRGVILYDDLQGTETDHRKYVLQLMNNYDATLTICYG